MNQTTQAAMRRGRAAANIATLPEPLRQVRDWA